MRPVDGSGEEVIRTGMDRCKVGAVREGRLLPNSPLNCTYPIVPCSCRLDLTPDTSSVQYLIEQLSNKPSATYTRY